MSRTDAHQPILPHEKRFLGNESAWYRNTLPRFRKASADSEELKRQNRTKRHADKVLTKKIYKSPEISDSAQFEDHRFDECSMPSY